MPKALAQKAVRNHSKDRSIKDFDQGGEIRIPVDSLREPRLHRSSQGGTREGLLPGNKKFVQGDTIPKEKGGGGGRGSDGSEGGEGEDEFRFVLSQEEYLDLFFDDLELPDLAKKTLASTENLAPRRARLLDIGLSREPVADPHHAQQPFAAGRAQPTEVGGDAGHGSRDRAP